MINKVKSDVEYYDILEGCRWDYKVHEHGLVSLVDVMPRLVPLGQKADYAIVQAARVSYAEGTKQVNEDKGLIRYLMRHRHTTPSEMVEFKFHCAMPIFVARQWIRHRTANVNEMSGRYSVLPDKFYYPKINNVREQSVKNKQCSEGSITEIEAEEFIKLLEQHCKQSYSLYELALSKNIGREQARMVLPVNLYTEWYWKIDLHNLLHFLSLRADKHAQQEIQDYANAMIELIKPIVPVSIEAWDQYHPLRNGMLLSQLEVEAIKTGIFNSENKREISEWEEKRKILGI
jgi:thymidylate synthase (FAD)